MRAADRLVLAQPWPVPSTDGHNSDQLAGIPARRSDGNVAFAVAAGTDPIAQVVVDAVISAVLAHTSGEMADNIAAVAHVATGPK
jgi:hypothetical protein